MIKVLVVDSNEERRADIVDALCELPGVEVCATATAAAQGLAQLGMTRIDVVVAASDLAGASIVTLIDGARRRGLTEIIVRVPNRVLGPDMREYWKDLGARAVVETVPELVGQLQDITEQRRRKVERRRHISQRVEHAVFVSGPAARVVPVTSLAGIIGAPRHSAVDRATPTALVVGDVLRELQPRIARLLHEEIELVLEVAADVPPVHCSANDLERIALHLVLDAAEAIPLGGKIWLIVEREGQRHVRIEVLDSSGTSRAPGADVDAVGLVAERHGGELRVVELGCATSLQVALPAIVAAAS